VVSAYSNFFDNNTFPSFTPDKGIFLYYLLRKMIYLVLIPLGITAYLIGKYRKPKTDFENSETVVKHIKRLLGKNHMMPQLILETSMNALTRIIIIFMALDFKNQIRTFEINSILIGFLISIFISIWLTRQMTKVWDLLMNGKRPPDYGDALLFIANTLILFYLVVGVSIFAGVISLNNKYASLAIIGSPMIINGWQLFKKTYIKS